MSDALVLITTLLIGIGIGGFVGYLWGLIHGFSDRKHFDQARGRWRWRQEKGESDG